MERRIAYAEHLADQRTKAAPAWSSPVELAADLGLTLDDWQRDVLTSTATQIVMLAGRQTGKTTCAVLLGLYEALCKPGSLTLVLSPGERQSGRLFRTLLKAYRHLGYPVAADVENRLSLELANGASVHAMPGNEARVRGFSGVTLLLEDEAALVPDALYQACRPMTAVSGGRVVLMSTPRGRRGHFYNEFVHGGPDWFRVSITASACARIPTTWLAEERDRIGSFWYDQEYGCLFLDDETQVFASELIDAAVRPDFKSFGLPRFGGQAV